MSTTVIKEIHNCIHCNKELTMGYDIDDVFGFLDAAQPHEVKSVLTKVLDLNVIETLIVTKSLDDEMKLKELKKLMESCSLIQIENIVKQFNPTQNATKRN